MLVGVPLDYIRTVHSLLSNDYKAVIDVLAVSEQILKAVETKQPEKPAPVQEASKAQPLTANEGECGGC